MLKQRVITAVLLLLVLLPALFAPMTWPFTALTLLFVAAGAWEWVRLNGGGGVLAVASALLLALACGAAWVSGWVDSAPGGLWLGATGLWVLGGALALKAGPAGWGLVHPMLRCAVGLVVLWLAWLAMCAARARGLNFIVSVFSLVWISDIAAYFGGRAWGRRKLAPSISPGKSWEGVWSGMVVVLLVGGLWVLADRHWKVDSPSLYSVIFSGLGVLGMMLMTVFLTAMGVVGDLTESLVKRNAGAKDSSGLLPGHGGVLDRVDALLPVFPMAVALGALT
jgi:phosphatidate cytidylyltransferase